MRGNGGLRIPESAQGRLLGNALVERGLPLNPLIDGRLAAPSSCFRCGPDTDLAAIDILALFTQPSSRDRERASLALPQADHVARPQDVPRCTAARF
jgi:hypothetical protein